MILGKKRLTPPWTLDRPRVRRQRAQLFITILVGQRFCMISFEIKSDKQKTETPDPEDNLK